MNKKNITITIYKYITIINITKRSDFMQDAKTGGSRWVPDIREDEITEFQEQNGDETATYKAVNVHPIISRVLDKLAFFRTHVSAVWYNKLANKTVKDKLDEIDTSINSLNSSKAEFLKIINLTQSTINQPLEVIKENWNDMPDGIFLTRIICGTVHAAIIQRLDDGAYGSALILGYALSTPLFYRCNSGTWS